VTAKRSKCHEAFPHSPPPNRGVQERRTVPIVPKQSLERSGEKLADSAENLGTHNNLP
jgi:hypothetical protein